MNASLLLTVLGASLLGSLHCAGMCGVFVSLACGVGGRQASKNAPLQLGYHGGRLVGYALLGAIAGSVGGIVDLGLSAAGFGRVAALLAAGTMLVIAVVTLLSSFGIATKTHVKPPAFMTKLFRGGADIAQKLTPLRRATLIGSLTVLLPCGWLYAFAVLAAATASPLEGALVMASFWAGTVPVLAALGVGVHAIRARLGPALQPIAGVLFLVLGSVALIGVIRMDDDALSATLTSLEQNADQAEPPTEAHCPLCEGYEPEGDTNTKHEGDGS